MKKLSILFVFLVCGFGAFSQHVSGGDDVVSARPCGSKENEDRDVRVGDYIKFSLHAGLMLNNAYCNKVRREYGNLGHLASENYSGYSKQVNASPLFGFNFLFGRSPYVKHIVSVNYLRSKGTFNYSYGSLRLLSNGFGVRYSEELNYESRIDFINVVTGIRFTIAERLHLEPALSFNAIVNRDERITGTTEDNHQVRVYTHERAFESKISNTISFCPRISYQFDLKTQNLEMYFSYNMAYKYRLPWWMLGFSYYPFKNLRPEISTRQIKLFRNVRIGVDVGVTLNRGNSPKNGIGGWNFNNDGRKIYSGANVGMHLIQGQNKFLKSVTNAVLIHSYSEFTRFEYQSDYSSSQKKYVYRSSQKYKTNAYYLDVSTGLRLTLFRHLNIDNSIGVNIPLMAQNRFSGSVTTEELTANGTNAYNVTCITTEEIKETTSAERFQKTGVIIHPRISYDLKIGE